MFIIVNFGEAELEAGSDPVKNRVIFLERSPYTVEFEPSAGWEEHWLDVVNEIKTALERLLAISLSRASRKRLLLKLISEVDIYYLHQMINANEEQ